MCIEIFLYSLEIGNAAIFLSPDVHDKRVKAKGCGLINHFTIMADYQCPTHVSNRLSQEGALANTHYILIESDGFGFGIDVERNQRTQASFMC